MLLRSYNMRFKLHVSFFGVKINIAEARWIILLLVIWKPAIARTRDKLRCYCLQMENDFIPDSAPLCLPVSFPASPPLCLSDF